MKEREGSTIIKHYIMSAHKKLMMEYLFLIIITVNLGIHITSSTETKSNTCRNNVHVYDKLKIKLKLLISEFSQPKQVWVQIIGQLYSIMDETPLRPAVIMVVVPQDTKRESMCFVQHVSESVAAAFDDSSYIVYNAKSDSHLDPFMMKQILDNKLQQLQSVHVAIIDGIESIPGNASMILHGYCDNDNAPYKQSLIFLILNLSIQYATLQEEKLDKVVDEYLHELWGTQLRVKDVSALVARVASMPVLVQPEKEEILDCLCPP
ncbi:torsin-1A-interacting protein 1 isoform X1 [Penaeus vannamei]|uniref:torsin-1A-interacting protein 1 isoform X1 n=2 Tax=Penaeus vannamei TaxID=6689 RepID=UPI000F68F532|nr:uncharacterized protein LOC113828725 isoform X1 [Penaeus vannamei]